MGEGETQVLYKVGCVFVEDCSARSLLLPAHCVVSALTAGEPSQATRRCQGNQDHDPSQSHRPRKTRYSRLQ